MHPSLTLSRIENAVTRSMFVDDCFPGFCTSCGRKAKQNCEPDARDYPCLFKSCGKDTVFGAEELLSMVAP